MVKQIDWGDGSGDKITLTYSATSGNQTVLVSSVVNAGAHPRSKIIKFTVVAGNVTIERELTITQPANSNGIVVITRNNEFVTYDYTGIGY